MLLQYLINPREAAHILELYFLTSWGIILRAFVFLSFVRAGIATNPILDYYGYPGSAELLNLQIGHFWI